MKKGYVFLMNTHMVSITCFFVLSLDLKKKQNLQIFGLMDDNTNIQKRNRCRYLKNKHRHLFSNEKFDVACIENHGFGDKQIIEIYRIIDELEIDIGIRYYDQI